MHTYRVLEKVLFPPTSISERKLRRHIEGKTILITGASSGIGEQLALLLAVYNVHLILAARSEDKLVALKRSIERHSAKVSVYRADLRDREQMDALVAYLKQLPNGLDDIVSNAGHSIKRSITDSLNRQHDFTRTMAINYFAPVQLLLGTIPLLARNQGHIIQISTVNTLLLPIPEWAAYQSSKSAFDTWFRSTAPELNVMGISTTTIYLPLVRTPMIEPTEAYQHMPAMSAQHAAHLIAKSMYTRKRTIKPWWIIGGQWASLLFRGIWERRAPVRLRKRRPRP